MPDEQKRWFELVKHNFRNPDPDTTKVVDTVRGLGYAERMAEVLTESLTPEEKEQGFKVYLRPGSKPAGVKRRRLPPNTRRNRR
jgi:hypothetical protein